MKKKSTADGLTNFISGLGSAKARNPASYLGADHLLDRTELENIYQFYWVAKGVDIRPWDMTREGRTFNCSDLDDDQIKTIEDVQKSLAMFEKARSALTWGSLYGGAGLIMHVDGHGDMQEELDYSKVQKDQLKRFSAIDRWELIENETVEYNPLSENYRTAEFYKVANDTTNSLIHRSRIVFFRGREMPVRITRRSRGWGQSDVQRWYQAIINNQTLASAIVESVHQSNVDVISVEGLANLLQSEGGDQKAIDRFMLMDMCKSMLNMSIIDSKDTFTRNAFPFSGLPETHKVFLEELASAIDIPITRLLGSSPSGMNSTGDNEIRSYYDSIKSLQINDLSPKLDIIDEVMIRSALGGMPENLSYEFNSLWQMTPEEDADLRQKQATTLEQLRMLGIDQFALHKDAIELGLVKNLTIEDVEKAEAEYAIEPDDEDFEEDDPAGGGSAPDGDIKTSKSGRKYRETSSGSRTYLD